MCKTDSPLNFVIAFQVWFIMFLRTLISLYPPNWNVISCTWSSAPQQFQCTQRYWNNVHFGHLWHRNQANLWNLECSIIIIIVFHRSRVLVLLYRMWNETKISANTTFCFCVCMLTLGGDLARSNHVVRILVFAFCVRYRFREPFWWIWWWSRNDGIICENGISIYINNNRWGGQMLGFMIARSLNRKGVYEKYSLESVVTTWPRGWSPEIRSSKFAIFILHESKNW